AAAVLQVKGPVTRTQGDDSHQANAMNLARAGMELEQLVDGFDRKCERIDGGRFSHGELGPIRRLKFDSLKAPMLIKKRSANPINLDRCVDQIGRAPLRRRGWQTHFNQAVSHEKGNA